MRLFNRSLCLVAGLSISANKYCLEVWVLCGCLKDDIVNVWVLEWVMSMSWVLDVDGNVWVLNGQCQCLGVLEG